MGNWYLEQTTENTKAEIDVVLRRSGPLIVAMLDTTKKEL
jgi:hypothetical protein